MTASDVYAESQRQRADIDSRISKIQGAFQKSLNNRLDKQTLKVMSTADFESTKPHPESQVTFVVDNSQVSSGGESVITAYKGDIELSNGGGELGVAACVDHESEGWEIGVGEREYGGGVMPLLRGSRKSESDPLLLYSGTTNCVQFFNADYLGYSLAYTTQYNNQNTSTNKTARLWKGSFNRQLFIRRGDSENGQIEMIRYQTFVGEMIGCHAAGSVYRSRMYGEVTVGAGYGASLVTRVTRHIFDTGETETWFVPPTISYSELAGDYTKEEMKQCYNYGKWYENHNGSNYIYTTPVIYVCQGWDVPSGSIDPNIKTIDVPYLAGGETSTAAYGLKYDKNGNKLEEPHLLANAAEKAVNYIFAHTTNGGGKL